MHGEIQKQFDMMESGVLRRELFLRMIIQNILLIITSLLVGIGLVLQVTRPEAAGMLALALCIVISFLAIMWCHHGARQAQIKSYLLILEQRYSSKAGWETWLPTHPIGGLLGSRWFISTKGVFMGGMVAACAAGFILDGMKPGMLASAAASLIFCATTALLLSNPKERLDASLIDDEAP